MMLVRPGFATIEEIGCKLSEHWFLHFAIWRVRQLRHVKNDFRNLECGQVTVAMAQHVDGLPVLARREPHECNRRLAENIVRHGHHRCFDDSGQFRNGVLDFPGGDSVAS